MSDIDAMRDAVANAFGRLGADSVQIGSTTIKTKKPTISNKPLVGHGDTVRVGDVVRVYLDGKMEVHSDERVGDRQELSMITRLDLKTADIQYMRVDGSRPFGLYQHPPSHRLGYFNQDLAYQTVPSWRRTFKLATPEETAQFKELAQYAYIYLRTFFTYGVPESRRVLVSLSTFLRCNGDIRKAFQMEAAHTYGKMPLKCMTKFDGKSAWKFENEKLVKVPIPEHLKEMVEKARLKDAGEKAKR